MIGYDLIPVTISETVTPGMSSNFANYLSVVKHIDRISCISLSSASEFRGFASMLGAQGLAGPHVVGQPLPSEAPDVPEAWLAAARELLAVDNLPLVLVVGSHEPRKNHLTVLVAAERLWREGLAFHLTFIGGSGWSSEAFDELVVELAERGRPVEVLKRADEETLWAAYRLARFTVFPSLTEGFGLPAAESLISGTPVITSNFGSLIEIAEGGGCLTVDPRDTEAVAAAMRDLLEDDALLARLRREAADRTWKTWDYYAKETWDHLTSTGPTS
jgi:glycosyltransferase involved in cell wall biosynthesis